MQSVSLDRITVDVDFQVRLADDAIGNHSGRLNGRNLLQQRFQFQGNPLDRFQVWAFDLHSHRCPHAALQHYDPSRNRLQFGCRSRPRNLCRRRDRLPNVIRLANLITPLSKRSAAGIRDQFACFVADKFVGFVVVAKVQPMTVLIGFVFRLVSDVGFEHRHGSRIERRVGATDLADDRFDLGNRHQQLILQLQYVECFTDRSVRHRCRHVEERAFIKRRHELFAESRQHVRLRLSRDRIAERWFPKRQPSRASWG